jgi:GNAT superfamily N-acetyltransferase
MMLDMEIRATPVVQVDEIAAFLVGRVPLLDTGLVRSMFDPVTTEHLHVWEARGRGGRLEGVAISGRPATFPASWRFTYVATLGDLAGGGLASRLWSALRSGLDAGAELLVTVVSDGDASAAAAARSWGFTVQQHSVTSDLDLSTIPTKPSDNADGVTFHPCDDLRFDDEDAVAAMVSASQTNPEAEAGLIGTLEAWRSAAGAGQRLVAVLARLDGRPAAISIAVADGEEMHVHYTGVDQELRGRALGRRVKEFLHAHAASQGVRLAITDNEDGNAGIRHVNEQLGYRPRSGSSWLTAPGPGAVSS